MNKVVVSGNLTRDPELRAVGSTSILEIGLAVNERIKENNEWVDRPNFFNVTVWGNRADALSKMLSKGSKVLISGRLRWSQWETDGQKRSKVEIVADDVELCGQRNQIESHVPVEVIGVDIPF